MAGGGEERARKVGLERGEGGQGGGLCASERSEESYKDCGTESDEGGAEGEDGGCRQV